MNNQNTLGKYGHMRLTFLKTHSYSTYVIMCSFGTLDRHLAEIDAQARKQVQVLTDIFATSDGVTEQLKAENQLLWVQRMNNCKARAEEIVLAEFIYV